MPKLTGTAMTSAMNDVAMRAVDHHQAAECSLGGSHSVRQRKPKPNFSMAGQRRDEQRNDDAASSKQRDDGGEPRHAAEDDVAERPGARCVRACGRCRR